MRRHTAVVTALVLGLAVLAWRSGDESVQPAAGMRAGIVAALDRSAAGWNQGDLNLFMGVYLDSPRTTYATHTKYLHGLAAIRGVYADRFAPGVARDSLRLVDIAVDSLTPTLASVMGFYELRRGDSLASRGPTSLVMERVGAKWLIVHDHSG
jgi:hypothetical protein